MAYTIYLDGMCSCGWPMVICRDPEYDGWFEIPDKVSVCQVQAVIDREAKERRNNQNYEPEPGELLGVVLTKPSAALDGSEESPTKTDGGNYQSESNPANGRSDELGA